MVQEESSRFRRHSGGTGSPLRFGSHPPPDRMTWLFPEIAGPSGDDQRARSVDVQDIRPRIAASDEGRVRAGPHQALGLEISALAAIDHVDRKSVVSEKRTDNG